MRIKPYFVKTPEWIKFLFTKQVWQLKTQEKVIYLTFDDGPIPEITPWVLTELKKHKARATFFCIADNVRKYPKIYKQLLDDGHQVGNHTFSHLNGWKTKTKNYTADIIKAKKHIQSTLFRPPYGKLKPKQSRVLQDKGYKIIMWDVLSADFDTTISPKKCLENCLKNTTKGSVVVFHDSLKAKQNLIYTLPKVLEYFSEAGFVFKSVIL